MQIVVVARRPSRRRAGSARVEGRLRRRPEHQRFRSGVLAEQASMRGQERGGGIGAFRRQRRATKRDAIFGNGTVVANRFAKKHGLVTPYRTAPEICVEVVSPSNSSLEIDEKITLYLAKGAQEMWVCDGHGQMTFHDHSGELAKSKMFPRFPQKIEY